MHEIQHEQSVYAAADLFQAVPTEDLCTEDLDGLSSTERAATLSRASALAGCLIYAADIVIDELIDDIVSLRAEENIPASAVEDTWVLSQLPAQFAASYTPLFAQRLLVAVVDVTARLTKGWEPLACVAQEGPLVTFLETVAPVMSRVRADDVAEVLGGIVSDVDRAALTGEFAEFMSEMIRRSLLAGIAGWKDDILASLRDWGFDHEANATPVFVWHGEEDRMVPYEHGRWLCDHIPGAIARLLPGQGTCHSQ